MAKIAARIELGQAFLWFISVPSCAILWLFAMFDKGLYIWLIFWLAVCLFVVITYIYSKVNTIILDENELIISNIYRKIRINKFLYLKIDSVYKDINFFVPLPLPSPPYFALVTTEGRRYIFLQANRSVFTLLTTSPMKQAMRLDEQIRNALGI